MALVLLTTAATAAVITTSTSAPTVDADDVSNLTAGTANLKYFSDVEHDAGQTFTPAVTGELNSFTVYIRNGRNDNDADPNEWVNVRLGTISRPGGVFTFTDFYSEAAYLTADWSLNDYVTFTFDTPQTLTGGTEYGVIIDAQNFGSWSSGGIPYLGLEGGYAGGNAIGRGSARSDDLVFEADIIPEPSSLVLASAGLLGLLTGRRRKRLGFSLTCR